MDPKEVFMDSKEDVKYPEKDVTYPEEDVTDTEEVFMAPVEVARLEQNHVDTSSTHFANIVRRLQTLEEHIYSQEDGSIMSEDHVRIAQIHDPQLLSGIFVIGRLIIMRHKFRNDQSATGGLVG